MARENVVAIPAKYQQELLKGEIHEVLFIPKVDVIGQTTGEVCPKHRTNEFSAVQMTTFGGGRMIVIGSIFADHCTHEDCWYSPVLNHVAHQELRRLIKEATPMTIDEALPPPEL